MVPAQRFHHFEGAIGPILHPADQLDGARVILDQEALEIGLEARLGSPQGLQQGQGGRLGKLRCTGGGQPSGEDAGGPGIGGADQAEDQRGVAQDLEQEHPPAFRARSSCAEALWQDGGFASPWPGSGARA